MSFLLNAALVYAARGWPVFPLHTPYSDGLCDCGERDCDKVGKHPRTAHGFKDATTDETQIRKWWDMWPTANIGIATGAASGLVVLDVDPKHGGDESLAKLEAEYGKLPDTVEAKTGGGGRHLLFSHPGGHVSCGIGSLGTGLDLKADGGYIVAEPSLHASGRRYSWDAEYGIEFPLASTPQWILNGAAMAPGAPAEPPPDEVRAGARNDTLASLAGTMRRRGMSQAEILAALLVANEARCKPQLDRKEVEKISASIARYEPSDTPKASSSPSDWPDPVASDAFYGLAGEVVHAIEPQTEADPVAILIQLLVAFGNFLGRSPYYLVERDRHYTNLYVVLVGSSSKARKGTSWGRVIDIFRTIEPPLGGTVDLSWAGNRCPSGLSTGEGLIWQVRDAVSEPKKDKYGNIENEITVQGVDDKRLLVVEPEFARVLKVMQRDGSTLSSIVRTLWETGSCRALSKNSPACTTNAHISIIGHVTANELSKCLTEMDAANGFGNRFMYFAVKRSKYLPDGGNDMDGCYLNDLAQRVGGMAGIASNVEQMHRDDAAHDLWHAEYRDLSEGRPGLYGAIVGRAEAQVLRMSMLYALLDGSPMIKLPHLKAALVLWKYAEDSARWIYGDRTGDSLADVLLPVLRSHPDGLDRTAIFAAVGRHRTAREIDRALEQIEKAGAAEKEVVKTGGRPREVWHACVPVTA